jgi:hypothetical protein
MEQELACTHTHKHETANVTLSHPYLDGDILNPKYADVTETCKGCAQELAYQE